MPITKRTRYEILKRDNHTCRYCGDSAPDVKITVDHVTPLALGGSDSPDNLVAACRDCNAGKSSTSPTAETVADVKQIDMQWAAAIKRAAAVRARERKKANRYVVQWLDNWNAWKNGIGEPFPLADNWESSIARFYELGVPIEELTHCADIACGNKKVGQYDTYRYFAGCAWRVVTEMQEAAKALLVAEEVDGDA